LMSAIAVWYTQSLSIPIGKEWQGVISDDLAGQEMGPEGSWRLIRWFTQTSAVQWKTKGATIYREFTKNFEGFSRRWCTLNMFIPFHNIFINEWSYKDNLYTPFVYRTSVTVLKNLWLQAIKRCICVIGYQWHDAWEVKVKLSLCLTKHHAMKTYYGSGGIASRILDLGTRWRWVVSFTSRPLYPQGKSPRYPLDRKLGGPQSRSGRGGQEKNSHLPPGIEP
jgi:hypothetical protein